MTSEHKENGRRNTASVKHLLPAADTLWTHDSTMVQCTTVPCTIHLRYTTNAMSRRGSSFGLSLHEDCGTKGREAVRLNPGTRAASKEERRDDGQVAASSDSRMGEARGLTSEQVGGRWSHLCVGAEAGG